MTGTNATKSQVTLLSGVIERLTIAKIVARLNKITKTIHKVGVQRPSQKKNQKMSASSSTMIIILKPYFDINS